MHPQASLLINVISGERERERERGERGERGERERERERERREREREEREERERERETNQLEKRQCSGADNDHNAALYVLMTRVPVSPPAHQQQLLAHISRVVCVSESPPQLCCCCRCRTAVPCPDADGEVRATRDARVSKKRGWPLRRVVTSKRLWKLWVRFEKTEPWTSCFSSELVETFTAVEGKRSIFIYFSSKFSIVCFKSAYITMLC